MGDNLGFHTFTKRGEEYFESSYFFPMPFGHFVFHPFDWSQKEFEFLEAKGGVWRVFIGNLDVLGENSKRLFDKFGAYHVVANGKDATVYSEFTPIEIFAKQFVDSKILMIPYGDHKGWTLFWYNHRLYLFIDNCAFLSSGEWRFSDSSIDRSFVDDLSKYEVDYVMFQNSTTSQTYQALTPDLFRSKLKQLQNS